MTSDQIACPYCNSHVSVARPLPAHRRLSCPRCGESFPYRGPEPETAIATAPTPGPSAPMFSPAETSDFRMDQPESRGWSNRAVAGTVLAVMGTMVAITLTGALATEHVRRAHDVTRPERRPSLSLDATPLVLLIGALVYFAFLIFHLVRKLRGSSPSPSPGLQAGAGIALILLTGLALGDLILIVAKTSALLGWNTSRGASATETEAPPPVRVVAPADLEGLGYLPVGTNAVMAFHVAQAMQTLAGRAFLDRSQLANSGIGIAEIQEATGLSREQIDQVVFGVRLDDSLLPAPVLVVRTRQPFDAGKIRSALKARRHPALGQKEVYDFELPRLKLNALLWCPTDRVLVVTIVRKVMEQLPLNADVGAERLVPSLRDFLKQRMPAGVAAWAVGHWTDGDTAPLLLASVLPADDRKLLAAVRTFGFWLRIDESIDLNAAIECADAAGAQVLEERLKQRGKDGPDFLKVLGGGERGELVSRELARTLRLEQKEKWVTLEATADAKTVREAVGGQ